MSKRKWQTKFRGSRVLRIAIAPENTDPPTTPNEYGKDMDWSNAGEWEANPFEFAPDDIRIHPTDDDAIQMKGASQPLKVGVFRDTIPLLWDRLEIPTAEQGRKVWKWATNVEINGKKIVNKIDADRVAFIVEMQGLAIVYCPSVEIYSGITEGGRKRASRQGLTVNIFGTDDVPTGSEWIEYEEEPS